MIDTTIRVNPYWRTLGRICGAVAVVLSATSAILVPILYPLHPADDLFLALNAGITALGVYSLSKSVEEIVEVPA